MNDFFFDFKQIDHHNHEVNKQELEKWKAQPLWYYGYIKGDEVTTWAGGVIGKIIYRNTFTNNLGKVLTNIRVSGTNGCMYYGCYGSVMSNSCRLRKARRRFDKRKAKNASPTD